MASPAPALTPSPQIPTRYEEVLNRRAESIEQELVNAGAEAARTGPKPGEKAGLRSPWFLAAVATALLVCVFAAMGAGRGRTGEESRMPFSRADAVKAAGLGVGGINEWLPPTPVYPTAPAEKGMTLEEGHELVKDDLPSARAQASPAPAPTPSSPAPAARGASSARARALPESDEETGVGRRSGRPRTAPVVLIADNSEEETAGITIKPLLEAPPPPPPAVVNLGTRFPVRLEVPVLTDAANVPVTALVMADVPAGDGVPIRAGSRLVGQAIAVRDNDRIQILFSALIQGGVTLPIQALAMQPDGQMGIPAKVIKKASGGKSAAGKVLGVVGGAASAATFGLIPTGGDVGDQMAAAMAREAAQDAAAGMEEASRRWAAQRSDKVLSAQAGVAFQVFLQADFKGPAR